MYTTASEQFAVNKAKLPIERQRYPRLTRAERVGLLTLFELACILGNQDGEAWNRTLQPVIRDLYSTKWAFLEIVRKHVSRLKWKQAPVLDQWSAKVKQGTPAATESSPAPSRHPYTRFMFNPAKYQPAEVAKLTQVCEASYEGAYGLEYRDGTTEEWKIIEGLAEGSIACRKLPSFVQSIMDSSERIRLFNTIQAQVEGELVMTLQRHHYIRVCQHSTNGIIAAILESAELVRVNLPALHALISQTKQIVYDRVTKSNHFFFFTRETAVKHQRVAIPFRGGSYSLTNPHRPHQGIVWDRQRSSDGHQIRRQAEYTVYIRNLTRFHDIGKLMAFLRTNIQTPFEVEDMDTCTPTSRTSTVWKLTFQLAGCPTFLQGVVRIMWFGAILIVSHPNVGRRFQCLQCGNIGHPIARCSFSDAQLRGPGAIVVAEQDIAGLGDTARPFASLKELRDTVRARIAGHRLAQESLSTPDNMAPVPPTSTRLQDSDRESQRLPKPVDREEGILPPGVELQPEPREPQPWITHRAQKGRSLQRRANKTLTSIGKDTPRALVSEASGKHPTPTPRTAPLPAELSSEGVPSVVTGDTVSPAQPLLLPAEEQIRVAGLARGQPPQVQGHLLLSRQTKSRATLSKLMQASYAGPSEVAPPGPMLTQVPQTFAEALNSLGMREVVTPASGNCLAMAIVQGATGQDLAEQTSKLGQLTATLKTGIKEVGLLNIEDRIPHDIRVTILQNVNRAWTSMTRRESLNQLKWFFEDYASSPSDREAVVADNTWGGNDIIGLAAMFLRRNIYVLELDDTRANPWSCRQFGPEVLSIKAKSIASFTERPMDILQCLDAIRADIIDSAATPIVLRFWGRHYSAAVPSPATREEFATHHDALMVAQPSRHDADEPMSSTSQTEDLAPVCGGPQQLALVESDASNALVTTDRNYVDTYLAPTDVVTQPPRICDQARHLRKRTHVPAPDDRIQDGVALKNIHTGVLLKKGKPEEYALVQYLAVPNDPMGGPNQHWHVEWNRGSVRWPTTASVQCPLVESGTAIWAAVAAAEPLVLLNHVQSFRFPGELIDSLADSVVAQWTEEWRRDCLQDCLARYRTNCTVKATRAWLDQWKQQIIFLKGRKVAGNLGDNTDYWKRIRVEKYGNDDLFRLCDPIRRVIFSHHILCAHLYHVEIGELLSMVDTGAGSRSVMEAHVQLLKRDAQYKSCYKGGGTKADWASIARFFESAFEKPTVIEGIDY